MKLYTLMLLGFVFVFTQACNSSQNQNPVTHVIEIKQMKFQPEVVQVSIGDTIRWINKDLVPHNVIDENKGILESGVLKTEETYSVVIRSNSKIEYVCTLHPVMMGIVEVLD